MLTSVETPTGLLQQSFHCNPAVEQKARTQGKKSYLKELAPRTACSKASSYAVTVRRRVKVQQLPEDAVVSDFENQVEARGYMGDLVAEAAED